MKVIAECSGKFVLRNEDNLFFTNECFIYDSNRKTYVGYEVGQEVNNHDFFSHSEWSMMLSVEDFEQTFKAVKNEG